MTTEEIKRALQCCIGLNGGCDGCPCRHTYYEEDNCRYIMIDAHNAIVELEKRCNALDALEQRCNALEVLEKRNEPVSLIVSQEIFGTFLVCGNCGEKLENVLEAESINGLPIKWNYCRKCGKAVTWDDND